MKVRQVVNVDFERFDLILTADLAHFTALTERCPAHLRYKLQVM